MFVLYSVFWSQVHYDSFLQSVLDLYFWFVFIKRIVYAYYVLNAY